MILVLLASAAMTALLGLLALYEIWGHAASMQRGRSPAHGKATAVKITARHGASWKLWSRPAPRRRPKPKHTVTATDRMRAPAA